MKHPSSYAVTGVLVSVFLATIGVCRAQEVLPQPAAPFNGHIGPTVQDSTRDFPPEIKARKGAPNILLILTDDVGFGASSAFGGPIPTPPLDTLAKKGLRHPTLH